MRCAMLRFDRSASLLGDAPNPSIATSFLTQ